MTTQKSTTQRFEEQKQRRATFEMKNNQAAGVLKSEQGQLERSEQEAIAALGTADVEKLRQLYADGVAFNERVTNELTAALDKVATEAKELEQVIAAAAAA